VLADLELEASGKVRDLYRVGDDRLLLVASDRISAFDVVLPTAIPDKGRVLTGLTLFWLDRTRDLVPNHLLAARPSELPAEARLPGLAGRTMLCRRLEMLPVEWVVRGYLSGSALLDYEASGVVSGHRLPPGLRHGDRLPRPILTPATKATTGHDENITREAVADLVGGDRLREAERVALAVYARAADHARARGLILADTKLEFGLDERGSLVLADEVLTPDSSRLWDAARRRPGAPPPSFDKQYVRDWLETQAWDKRPPGPALPPAVVAGTTERYQAAYRLLTDRTFDEYRREMEVLET
jgi:phosphoribosylaminoimidazole-succinocarboxamide synthase